MDIIHPAQCSRLAAYSTDSITQRHVITENKEQSGKNETVLRLPLFLKKYVIAIKIDGFTPSPKRTEIKLKPALGQGN